MGDLARQASLRFGRAPQVMPVHPLPMVAAQNLTWSRGRGERFDRFLSDVALQVHANLRL